MSKIVVLKGGSAMQTIANEHINALAIKFNSDALAIAENELPNFYLKLSLKSNDKVLKVFYDDSLTPLLNTNKSRFDNLQELFTTNKLLFFPFETTLNLTKGMTLQVECRNQMYNGTATTCEVNIEGVPSIGVMRFIPTIERIQLDSNLAEHNLQLGSHVSRVVYNGCDSDEDITSLQVKSDKIDAEFTPFTLRSQFSNSLQPYLTARDLPFNLVNDKHLQNNLSLKIKFVSASANREIYVIRNVMTPQIVNAYVRKTDEHNKVNLEQIKTIKTPDCACSK